MHNYFNDVSAAERMSIIGEVSSSPSSIRTCVQDLNRAEGGILKGMKLKEDTSSYLKKLLKSNSPQAKSVEVLDQALKQWIAAVFCYDNIFFRTITFENSCGDVLEKVIQGEAVHKVRSLGELKRRLRNGRTCFGLFHGSIPTQPVAFLHVAFCDKFADSMR